MRIRFVAVLCAAVMFLACFLVPMRRGSLAGTWVIYSGGSSAPDILHFEPNGTGEGYSLPDDYEEVWLQGQPVPDELLVDPQPFQWLVTGDEIDQLELTFQDGSSKSFELSYKEDMEGTGLPGIDLKHTVGSGGYVQATMEE